jgi:hypothetical protein
VSPNPPGERRASPTDAKDLMERGELRVLGLLPRASNYTFLGEVSDEGRTALVVYKPREGETPLWDFPDGTLCRREVAASVLADWLGWPRVPPTIIRDGPHGPGAVQLFVDADPREHYFTLRETRLGDFRPVAAFDVVINNADRKSGHCLLTSEGGIWLVDHGTSFSVEPKLRTVIWDFGGEPLPASICSDLQRLAIDLESGPIREKLLDLLDEREVSATARRTRSLVRSGRFPSPGARRAYPWPPV